MSKSEHAASKRSPLRRRLEAAIQSTALLFIIALGSAIYQNVSKGAVPSVAPSLANPADLRSNDVRPRGTAPRDARSDVASPNGPTPVNAPPGATMPSGEGPGAAATFAPASSEPSGGDAPPPQSRPSKEEAGITAMVKAAPDAALLSPAPLACEKGSPSFWQFANVELIDSVSGRASSLVASCHVTPVSDGLAACQDAVIVGVGVASSKGINATESARALRRGINLAAALKKDLQARCTTGVSVSAYVLNLGRYSDEQQRDEPDQRKVIALMATGSNDADKSAADAVVTFAKSEPQIAHYPLCALYKLDDAGQPAAVPMAHNNCGDQTSSTVSQQ